MKYKRYALLLANRKTRETRSWETTAVSETEAKFNFRCAIGMASKYEILSVAETGKVLEHGKEFDN